MSEISASVIQVPVLDVVNTGDLQAVMPGNVMIKFADDAYLIIPAADANSRQSELDSVELWSLRANNLKVNPTKYAEMIVVHNKRKAAVQLSLPMPNIARVSTQLRLNSSHTRTSARVL